MSDREFAFGQLLATLGPLDELEQEFVQCVFNAGWDASEAAVPATGPGVMLTSDAAARDFARSVIRGKRLDGEAGR